MEELNEIGIRYRRGDIIKIIALDDGNGNPNAYGSAYKIGDYKIVKSAGDRVIVTTDECYLYKHEIEHVVDNSVKKEVEENINNLKIGNEFKSINGYTHIIKAIYTSPDDIKFVETEHGRFFYEYEIKGKL